MGEEVLICIASREDIANPFKHVEKLLKIVLERLRNLHNCSRQYSFL